MMKLLNKQSGKIYDSDKITFMIYGGEYGESEETYLSLEELNEDWEEVKQKGPLIKDEKIRKAVKAWAEVNEYDKLWVYHDNEAISFYNEDDDDNEIIFNTMKKFELRHLKCYTIDELCGEEEE